MCIEIKQIKTSQFSQNYLKVTLKQLFLTLQIRVFLPERPQALEPPLQEEMIYYYGSVAP